MKTPIIAAAMLLLSAAVPAMAANDAATCQNLSKDVATAMASAIGDTSPARVEQLRGQQSCQSGQWDNGAVHYRKALRMLGRSETVHAPAG